MLFWSSKEKLSSTYDERTFGIIMLTLRSFVIGLTRPYSQIISRKFSKIFVNLTALHLKEYTLRPRYPALFIGRIPSQPWFLVVAYRGLSLMPGRKPSQTRYPAIFLGFGFRPFFSDSISGQFFQV